MIKVKKIVNTCSACPSQWEGLTYDNRQIYFRYRWSCLTVRIGEKDDMSKFGAVRGNYVFELEYGNSGFDGSMDYETLKKLVAKKITLPNEESDKVDWIEQ
jgi:hypothetical protein